MTQHYICILIYFKFFCTQWFGVFCNEFLYSACIDDSKILVESFGLIIQP